MNTGGVVPGKSGTHLPGADASDCSVTEASVGTHQGPNAGPPPSVGGKGSTGSASSSSPSGG